MNGIPTAENQLKWELWVQRVTLITGAALVLSGIVYFFAYNWAGMGKATKLIVIQAAIAGTFALSIKRGLKRMAEKTLLFSSALLTGVLLAVYGQIYQTGADAYTLFLGWLLLISGWIFTARNKALWVLWAVLWNLTFVTWYGQVINPDFDRTPAFFITAMLMINGAILLFKELYTPRFPWLRGTVPRIVPQTLILCCSTWYLMDIIFSDTSFRLDHPGFILLACLASLTSQSLLFLTYRFYRPNPAALFLTLCALAIVLLSLIGKFLSEITDKMAFFFLFSFSVLGVSGAVILYFKMIQHTFEGQVPEPGTAGVTETDTPKAREEDRK